MAKHVTTNFTVTYDTLEEYNNDILNVQNYLADQSNPPVTNLVENQNNLTISYTVTVTV